MGLSASKTRLLPKQRVRRCKHCGEKPVLHIIPIIGGQLTGFVCRRCSPGKSSVFTSLVKAKQRWNYANK